MLLDAMDSLYIIGQLMGKSLGIIDAHDPTVEDVRLQDRHHARIAGVDPGWPEFVVDLPADARFHQAMSGPLTRSGGWFSHETVSDLKRFFEPRVAALDGRWKVTERGATFAAASEDGLETTLGLAETEKLGGMILIRQKRTDHGLKASMKSRLQSLEYVRRR